MRRPLVLLALLTSISLGCEKRWDWREHFVVECMVLPDLGEVAVNTRDLPEGATVESPELPELADTINASGIYMTRASLVPLASGPQTLTFIARSNDETATTTCSIERPVLAAVAKPVGVDAPEFTRALVSYTFVVEGGASEPLANQVPIDAEGAYLLPFQAWKPQNIKVGERTITADDRGVFNVPVPAELGKPIEVRFDNPDKQSVHYTLTLATAQPWLAAEATVLRSGAEGGYAWAAALPEPRLADKQVSAVLVGELGDLLAHIGPMQVLGQVERVARMVVTEETVEVCDYGTPEGLHAKITRVAQQAEVVLRDARTGNEVARTTLKGKPDKCPAAADFSFVHAEGKDATSFDRTIVGEAFPVVEPWFSKESQR
jgi:hypothetical protein